MVGMTTMKTAGRARAGSGRHAPVREPAAEPVAVRIFGPLTITRGGTSVPLRSAKQRRLLALLALHPGRPVPHAEIVRTLWDDAAPDGARSLLYSHVARLRSVVGTGIVVTQPGGYRLGHVPGTGPRLAAQAAGLRVGRVRQGECVGDVRHGLPPVAP